MRHTTRFLLWLAELLSAPFRCARLSKSSGRKPASIGRLRVGCPETRVNSGLADKSAGNARKQWACGQPLRKCPFYAGFRAALWRGYGRCCRRSVVGAVVGLRPPAVVIQPAMRPSCAAGGRGALPCCRALGNDWVCYWASGVWGDSVGAGAAGGSAGRWIRRCSRRSWSKRVAADRRCSVFPRSRGGTAERDS